MKIQEHIDKISWSLFDKGLMVIFGLVSFFQVKIIPVTEEFALYFLLSQLLNWLFAVSDSLALQNIIQFGAIKENRPKVNLYAVLWHVGIGLGIPLLIFIFREKFAEAFNEPGLAEMALVLPALAALALPRNFVMKLLIRDHRFRDVFIVNLFYFGIMSFLTFYYYFDNRLFDFDLMIQILLAGNGLSSAVSLIIARKELIFGTTGDFNRKKMFTFSLPYFYYATLHSIPQKLDSYILKALGFPTATIGVYGAVKILYRVFEEGANATYGLIYPVSVKLTTFNRIEELKSVMTKFVSFMLVLIIPAVLLLNLGLTEFIVSFFDNPKYDAAVGMFNFMVIGAIAIPFNLLALVISASGKPKITLKYVFISVVVSMAGFLAAGYFKNEMLIPLGLIGYNFTLGILSFMYIKRTYGFPIKMVLRAYSDTLAFIKEKIKPDKK